MPLQEAVAATPQDVIVEAATMPLSEHEQTALSNEATQPTAQGYEYTRQDGTVEHAANREEAIKLCPVLGKLAVQDSEAANMLLDMASIGQAKMAAEKVERPKPETPKQAESAVKPGHSDKKAEQSKVQPSEKADNATSTGVITPADVAHLERQAQEAAASMDQKSGEGVSEQNKPSVSESGKIVVEREPEQQLHQEQASPLRHNIAMEGQLIHEQQIQETARTIAPDKAIAVVGSLEPQSDVAEIARRTFVYEGVEAGQALEFTEQSQIAGQEYVEQTTPVVIDVLSSDELKTFELEQSTTKLELAEWIDWTAEVIDDTPRISAEMPPQIETVSWANELDKEPLQIYESFSEALQLLVAMSGEQSLIEPGSEPTITDENDLVKTNETQKVEALPDIAVVVSERFCELEIEDKETVEPILADIVETMHVIEVLKSDEAETEAIETVQMELEELVITLFEHLGIEYEVEDVTRFVATLLRPEFLQPQLEVVEPIAVDLEHDGTHEAKYHFSQAVGSLADAEDQTQNLLGKLILFYVIGSRPRNLTPVY